MTRERKHAPAPMRSNGSLLLRPQKHLRDLGRAIEAMLSPLGRSGRNDRSGPGGKLLSGEPSENHARESQQQEPS